LAVEPFRVLLGIHRFGKASQHASNLALQLVHRHHEADYTGLP
jgi:hypothetical protein